MSSAKRFKKAQSLRVDHRLGKATRVGVELMETRRLMSTSVSGAITTNTVWNATNSPYILTGATYIRQGATLTIQSGVTVQTSNSSALYISDDSTAAAINATGVTFDVQINTNSSSTGSITSSVFNTAPVFASSSTSAVAVSGNTFNAGVEVYPNYVPSIVGNTFAANSTVYVAGGTATSTSVTWGVIPNVSQYEIVGYTGGSYNNRGVHLVSGATLTLGAGVKVTTDGASSYGTYDGIYISEDASGSKLIANGSGGVITITAPVYLDGGASATINNCQIGGSFFAGSPGAAGIAVTGSSFSQTPTFAVSSSVGLTITGDTFAQSVSIYPQIVPLVNADSFSPNSTLFVLNGTTVSTSVTWSAIPNVTQYEMVAYTTGSYNNRGVHVISGATLTINPGLDITTDGSNSYDTYDGIYVSEDSSGAKLIANGSAGAITITAPLYLQATASASIINDQVGGSLFTAAPGVGGDVITGDSFAQTPTFAVASTAGLTITGDSFSQSVNIFPQIIPLLNNDIFSPNATLYVLGGTTISTSVTWSVIPNVSQYEIVSYASGSYNNRGVHVISGATLSLSPGLDVTTDGSSSYGTYDGIYVSEDSSGAKLIANGSSGALTLIAPIYLQSTASATIINSQIGGSFFEAAPGVSGIVLTGDAFSQTPTFAVSSSVGLTITGDTFPQSVNIYPQIVPLINSDTFSPNSTVYVLGGTLISTSVTWSVIPNVSNYEIVSYAGGNYNNRGVHVISGATLTLSPGVDVTTDGSSSYGTYDGIYVSEDSSGAKLIANGTNGSIQITAPVYLESTASATMTDCQLGGNVFTAAPGAGGIAITGSAFSQTPTFAETATAGLSLSGDSFGQSVNIYPEIIPLVNLDVFNPNATIYVLGGTIINSSVTWSAIANVSQYEIVAYAGGNYNNRGVHVVSGAALTLGAGVEVSTDNSSSYGTYDGIYVAEDSSAAKLNAVGATLVAPIYLTANAGGSITYSTFDKGLTISGSSTATVDYDSIGSGGVTATGSSNQSINLLNNWWGTTNAATIATLITDHSTNSSLPTILYNPYLSYDPTVAQAVSLSGYASYYLKHDADGVHTDVYDNATGTGSPAEQLILNLVSALNVTASGGAGSVTFDNSNGNVLPTTVSIAGDGSTSLVVMGLTSGDSVTLNSGQFIDDASTISFSGITSTRFNPDGGSDNLSINAGKLVIPAPVVGSGITLRQFPSISIADAAELQIAAAATHADRAVVLTSNLSIAGSSGKWTGTFDLGNNDLDIQNGTLATVMSQLAEGYNGGQWNSTGLESLSAAVNSLHLTALGSILNNQNGTAYFNAGNPFDGLVPGASDLLIKYTYYGDANLDGKVDGSDYSRIDSGFVTHAFGWSNGDFNYDNLINGSDYTLIDNAFNTQGASLASQTATAVVRPVSAVNTFAMNSATSDSKKQSKNDWFSKARSMAEQIFSS